MTEAYTRYVTESRFWDSHSKEWLDQQPNYKLKTRYFLNGTVDFIMSLVKPLKTKEIIYGEQACIYPRKLSEEEEAQKRQENIERAARRAKQCVHHIIRQIGADHMLTLTTRENITDREEFLKIFSKFVRLVKTKQLITTPFGLSDQLATSTENRIWHYVACHELQERGAYHMHVACVGRQDIPFLRACWYQALGGHINAVGNGTPGQIDVQQSKKRWSGLSDVHKTFKLVGYLTKYITKSFESSEELGKKRYLASRQVPKPIVHKQFLVSSFSCTEKTFTESCKEVFEICGFLGVRDLEPWNRGLDIFILRGTF